MLSQTCILWFIVMVLVLGLAVAWSVKLATFKHGMV